MSLSAIVCRLLFASCRRAQSLARSRSAICKVHFAHAMIVAVVVGKNNIGDKCLAGLLHFSADDSVSVDLLHFSSGNETLLASKLATTRNHHMLQILAADAKPQQTNV